MQLDINPDEMTLGEVEFFEEASGLTFDDLAAGRTNTKAILALVVISERRTNPSYSMDDARQVKLGDVKVETNPTEPATARARSSK